MAKLSPSASLSPIVGTVLLPGGTMARAIVHVSDGHIDDVNREPSASIERALRRDGRGTFLRSDTVLAPAFVDVHCHGAGGGSAHGDAAALLTMRRTLLSHGVGAFLATTMTAPLAHLMTIARRVARTAQADPQASVGQAPAAALLGLHLEGPALTLARSAGHDLAALTSPKTLSRSLRDEPRAWRAVRAVTLAPELDGGLELVRDLVRAGIVASVGHTDGDFDQISLAFAAGARSTTHIFSGMPMLHHRAPGPVGAALAAAPFIELITDGVHIRGELLPSIARAIGEDRLVLVSDAAPLAASRRRRMSFAGAHVHVEHERVLDSDGILAGSRLLLDGMVEAAVRSGVPLEVALRAASENPARLLRQRGRGALEPGAVADLVTVSAEGRLLRVLHA